MNSSCHFFLFTWFWLRSFQCFLAKHKKLMNTWLRIVSCFYHAQTMFVLHLISLTSTLCTLTLSVEIKWHVIYILSWTLFPRFLVCKGCYIQFQFSTCDDLVDDLVVYIKSSRRIWCVKCASISKFLWRFSRALAWKPKIWGSIAKDFSFPYLNLFMKSIIINAMVLHDEEVQLQTNGHQRFFDFVQ